jgi:purine-binding chemotaxis protein CheW
MSNYLFKTSDFQQLVSFHIDTEKYSFPIDIVQEIVKFFNYTVVPGAHETVKGIMNLRGNILPLINLRKRLGFKEKEFDKDTRIIVITSKGLPTGIIVDKLDEVLNVTAEEIEPPPNSASDDQELLKGIAKVNGGEKIVMVLDENRIIPDKDIYNNSLELKNSPKTEIRSKAKQIEPEKLIISFKLETEEFAMDIMNVQEILRLRDITDVPKSPDFLLGIMKLRENIIPVIDIKALLGLRYDTGELLFKEKFSEDSDYYDETDMRRIVVLNIGETVAAILVDAVFEVLRISEKLIEPFPHSGDKDKYQYAKGVCKLDNGKRLLTLVSLSETLSKESIDFLHGTIGEQETEIKDIFKQEDTGEEIELVCFDLGGEEYGINIMEVREIIRFHSITTVPNSPDYVAGIVNLRGNVLPVIDLRIRFDKEVVEWNEENRIVVVEMGERLTGLIVDNVNDVITISENEIEYTKSVMKSDDSDDLIKGICKLDNGEKILILLDVNAVLKQEEFEKLNLES